jgi:hypothetical protein
MTGSKEVLDDLKYQLLKISQVTIGDGSELKVLGHGKVVISPDASIEKVLLVESLGYNLLSVLQLCECNFTVVFGRYHVLILHTISLKVAFVGFVENRMYVVDFSKETTHIATSLMAKSDVGWLWHRRLGHVGMRNLQTLVKGEHVQGLTNVNFSKDRPCSSCVAGKMHEKNHPKVTIITTSRPFELIHMDLFGPPTYESLGGKKYCLVIVDDYTRYTWTFYIKKKNEVQGIFIDWTTQVERQYATTILAIRSDNGTEFKNYTMDEFLSIEGIRHQYSAAYTPQQNGVVERKNRTLIDMARTMLAEFKSPYNFWAEAINTACHLSNRLYLRPYMNKTSYELLVGKKPNLSYVKVFGCKCQVYIKDSKLPKFEPKTFEGIFVGYAKDSHTYRIFNISTGCVEESMNVVFHEDNGSQVGQIDLDDVGDEPSSIAIGRMGIGPLIPVEEPLVAKDVDSSSMQVEPSTSTIDQTANQEQEQDLQIDTNHQDNDQDTTNDIDGQEIGEASPRTPIHSQIDPCQDDGDDEDVPPNERPCDALLRRITSKAATLHQKSHYQKNIIGGLGRSVSTRRQLGLFCGLHSYISHIEPVKVYEALEDEDWVQAMHEELHNFERNKVWSLVERPKDHNVIGTKWVFKNKQDNSGQVIRNKARLVAQGYSQVEGLDYGETFAPVARLESIRILLAFASSHGFILHQMDVKSAFLNGPLSELVYVKQPPGFEDPKYPNHVYLLHKALYGLKQAPRAWYDHLKEFLVDRGFVLGVIDPTLFTKSVDGEFFVCQIYVDDIIFGSTNMNFVEQFAKLMTSEFEMSMMGKLEFFLGFEVQQYYEGTFISQAKYIQDMLKKFDMTNANPLRFPMATNVNLSLDHEGIPVDQKLYRSMIGSLLYLCASRPDIAFSVGLCARFQSNPKESHMTAVKRILRYLVDTPQHGLWYPSNTSFDLVGYSDADWAGDKVARKSTSGACQFLGRSLVCWSSRKQNCISTSSTEAEYIAAASCCSQLLWMRQCLKDFGIKIKTLPLLCDNESAIKIAQNPVLHGKTKHIEIRYHFIRDHVANGDISLSYVNTKDQLADIFTKPLDEKRFKELRGEINVVCASNFI